MGQHTPTRRRDTASAHAAAIRGVREMSIGGVFLTEGAWGAVLSVGVDVGFFGGLG